jgi:uncharacterized protein YjbI with pentapeptide repeats
MEPSQSPQNEPTQDPSADICLPPPPPRPLSEELADLLCAGNVAKFNEKRGPLGLTLQGLTIQNRVLDGIDLSGTYLKGCTFIDCSFTKANLNNSTLDKTTFSHCFFIGTPFEWTIISESTLEGTVFEKASLVSAQFIGCTIADTLITSTDAEFFLAARCSFLRSQMSFLNAPNAIFRHCELRELSIHQSDLKHAVFQQCFGYDFSARSTDLRDIRIERTRWGGRFTIEGAFIHSNAFTKEMFDPHTWDSGEIFKRANVDRDPPAGQFAQSERTETSPRRTIDGIPGTDIDLYEAAMKRLDGLVGLAEVKQEIQELAALLIISRARREYGSTEERPTLHYVFSGSPGTGKTTVARIMADLLKSLGYLKQGQCVETDRAGLVAGFVGQTAIKTHSIIEEAIGGVLFIDEAYALTPDDPQDMYGAEAIAVLLKEMEDHRHDLVVIVAGYPSEMKRFIESNPGLDSRFSQQMNFTSFSRTELEKVYETFLGPGRFTMDAETRQGVGLLGEKLRAQMGEKFGNARTMRTIFEKMCRRQAVRVTKEGMPATKETLCRFTFEDIPSLEMLRIPTTELRALLSKKGYFISTTPWTPPPGSGPHTQSLPLN